MKIKQVINEHSEKQASYPRCPLTAKDLTMDFVAELPEIGERFSAWQKELAQYCWDTKTSFQKVWEYEINRVTGGRKFIRESAEKLSGLGKMLTSMFTEVNPAIGEQVDVVDFNISLISETVSITIVENTTIEQQQGNMIKTDKGIFEVGVLRKGPSSAAIIKLAKPNSAKNCQSFLKLSGDESTDQFGQTWIEHGGWKFKVKVNNTPINGKEV